MVDVLLAKHYEAVESHLQRKTLLPCLLAAIVIIGTFGSQNVLAVMQIANVSAPKTSTTVQTATPSSTTQQTSNQTSLQNRVAEEEFYFGIIGCGLAIILVGVIIYYVYGPKRRKETANQTGLISQTTPQPATQVPQESASSDDMMFCIQCGFRIPRKSKTCKECGAIQA